MYQMSPMSWLQLMVYFIMVFMMINMINFYYSTNNTSELSNYKTAKNISWKW